MKTLSSVPLLLAIGVSVASAQSFKISLGIRETGGSGPAFSNAGSGGGIEWVRMDEQTLVANGTWQLFTFMPAVDTLTAFAGGTANGVLDTDWVSLENIRILNSEGHTAPIRLWIDDINNTDSQTSAMEGFEGFAVGDEVVFQEPTFSGSTSGNILAGGTAAVSDSMAFSGAQANEVNFQFVDGDPTRWVRLTTFNALNIPNPAMHVRESAPSPVPGSSDVVAFPTISFYMKAILVPEPSTMALLGMGLLALLARRRK